MISELGMKEDRRGRDMRRTGQVLIVLVQEARTLAD
jgi:hypothetical protein